MPKKSYMIFLQKTLDCIYDTTKVWKNACIGLRWFCVDQIRWICIHPQHVSKIVILYMDIMLNLLDINNFLFLYFYKKIGLTSTIFTKEEFIPRIEKIKWWWHKLFMPQATCRFHVLWILHVRGHEAAREIHKRSRTCKHLFFARIDA